jgi:hypothetical protein
MTFPLTSTAIMLGPSAADSNACTGTALPITLSNLECRTFPPPNSTQSLRIALDRWPRAQTNRLPLAGASPASTSSANKPSSLSP